LIDGQDLVQKIGRASNNAPISLAIDAVGGETFTRLSESLSNGATLVAYGSMSGKSPILNPAVTIFNDIRIRGFWLSKWFKTATVQEKQAAFGQIIPLVASGALQANIDSRFNVADIKAAVTRAAEKGRNGKVLIVPSTE
jgi:NADPH:quinone reductase-like Zn-dependent oxidoreductase